ncbi:hypothetical protein Tco_1456701 [Tanacetum coccineum]
MLSSDETFVGNKSSQELILPRNKQEELFTHKEKMAPMALSDSKNDTGFKAATYKRGHKEYQMRLLRDELEKVKQENEGFEFKIAKFDKSAKDLEQLLASQITDKSKKGFGYMFFPLPQSFDTYKSREENIDDSLEQHQITDTETSSIKSSLKVDKDWKEKFFYPANHVESAKIEKPVRKNNDAPIIEDWVSDDEDEVETTVVVKKKTVIPTAAKIEKPVRKPVRYAEMYRSQRPRGNQRNWNGQKSNQLGCNFVFNNKACFICGSFDHIQYSCPNQQRKRIMDAQAQGRQECSKEKEESREECSKSRKTKKMKWEDCWELNTSELVLPMDELVLLSQQLVLLEENSSYCSRLQLPVLNQSVNTARITAVGEKVNAAESLLVVSTEVNAN